MKISELFEAKTPDDFRSRQDWTSNKFHTNRSEYDAERKQKLGNFGTISTLYKDAVNDYRNNNYKKLDYLIIASLLTSIGYDKALIDRSTNIEDSLKRDIKVGVVRGKNFGTYQEQKTIEGFIRNGGNLNQVYVSKLEMKDENGNPTGVNKPIDARQYWTMPYRKGVDTPMLQSKIWLHAEHTRIEEVNSFLNSTPANISVQRINEIINVLKNIEKFEKLNKDKFEPAKVQSREIKIQANKDQAAPIKPKFSSTIKKSETEKI